MMELSEDVQQDMELAEVCKTRYFNHNSWIYFIGLIGKAEQMTHMDLNQDGRIGGGARH